MKAESGNDVETTKLRLRQDLLSAMKGKRPLEAKVIRSLLAAIDNAEAPPLPAGMKASDQLRFDERSAEIQRLLLDANAVRAILTQEISERIDAARELTRVGRPDDAASLTAEADFARRYL